MKAQCFLPLTIIMSASLFGLTKIRSKESVKDERTARFQEVRMRVAYDVLSEYQKDKTETQRQIELAQIEMKALEEAVNTAKTQQDTMQGEANACLEKKKPVADELASVEGELQKVQAELGKEKSGWTTELDALKKQLAEQSPVCAFLKADSKEGSKLCGVDEPKQEEQKAEDPKPEEAPKKR